MAEIRDIIDNIEKIYGSNNKKNWDVLVHKTSNIEYNYGAYFENVITSNEYQFFALVVNRLIGNERSKL